MCPTYAILQAFKGRAFKVLLVNQSKVQLNRTDEFNSAGRICGPPRPPRKRHRLLLALALHPALPEHKLHQRLRADLHVVRPLARPERESQPDDHAAVGEVERGQYGDELQPDEWGAGYKARDDGCGAVGAVSVRIFFLSFDTGLGVGNIVTDFVLWTGSGIV